MAEKQKLLCREHGGYFYREPKRGRKPVRCSESNQCDAAGNQPVERPAVGKATDPNAQLREQRTKALKRAVKGSESKSQRISGSNPSLDKGQAAKALLEAQGWIVSGKAWHAIAPDDPTDAMVGWASVTAARGEEMLHIVWKDGETQDQVYNLWNLDKPSANGKPNSKLPFDPDEIPDAELAQMLVGVRVKWWNRLAGKEETAVCGKDSIEIEHKWTGTGDEYPAARLIKFIDVDSGGYRHFRLEQLTKVG
jgi:hypothetical protein